jgi:hypothetical protein
VLEQRNSNLGGLEQPAEQNGSAMAVPRPPPRVDHNRRLRRPVDLRLCAPALRKESHHALIKLGA